MIRRLASAVSVWRDRWRLATWLSRVELGAPSMLRWSRSVGYASHDGVRLDMRDPPALDGDDIEYLPPVARIDGRDMTPQEREATVRLLEQMASDARDALCGQSTLVVVYRGDRTHG